MFCQVCGAQINDDAVFCPECGTTLKITPPRPKEVKPTGQGDDKRNAVCPFCGFEYYSRSDFCPRCGMDKKKNLNGAGMGNGQSDILGFSKEADAYSGAGGPNRPGAGSWDVEENPYGRGFNKYGLDNSQKNESERVFERNAMPQSRGPERDFEKYANARAPRRRGYLVLIIVGALVIAAAAVYFLLLR